MWTSFVKNKLSGLRFGYIWASEPLTKQEIDSQIPVLRFMKCSVQDYFSVIESQTKLRTYVKYKQDFKLEPYVTKLNFKNRQELSRLRLSDKNLKLNRAIHKPKTPSKDRKCTFCPKSVQDEYQYCPVYKIEREKLKRILNIEKTILYSL